jgi:hypothetical protein
MALSMFCWLVRARDPWLVALMVAIVSYLEGGCMYTRTFSGGTGGRTVPTTTCEDVEQAASPSAPRMSTLHRVRRPMGVLLIR